MLARVENLTQKTTVMRSGQVADKPANRMQGLFGTKQPKVGDGFLIMPWDTVNSLFTSSQLDVLYVDETHRVIAVDDRIMPNSAAQPRDNYRYMIEVPAGTIARTKTNLGDLLQIVFLGSTVQVTAGRFFVQ